MMNENITKGIAIVPGSFDPITLGHVDIVKRALEKYETVILAIMINPKMVFIENNSPIFSSSKGKNILLLNLKIP